MDIFKILQEAKNPSSTPMSIKARNIKTTDYTEEADIDDNESEDTADNEKTNQDLEDNNPDNENDEQETEDKASSEDQNNDEDETNLDDEGTDYTSDIGDDGENPDDTEGETDSSDTNEMDTDNMSPEEKDDVRKNALLIKNAIDLYYTISSTISRFDKMNGTEIAVNKILVQTKLNLTDLTTKLYDFITKSFNSNTYVKNLYVYNYFIEAFKINIEILRKMNTFSNLS